jgi:hypothetical protein
LRKITSDIDGLQSASDSLEGDAESQEILNGKVKERDEMIHHIKLVSYKLGNSPKSCVFAEITLDVRNEEYVTISVVLVWLVLAFVVENMVMMYGRHVHPLFVSFIPHLMFLLLLFGAIRMYRVGYGNPWTVATGYAAITWALLTLSDRTMQRYLETQTT